MPRQNRSTRTARRRHTPEFKAEALALAEQVGVNEAASQLGVQASQLYTWKAKARQASQQGQADQQLAAENARLKRQLAEAEQEVAILKNRPPAPPAPVARETVSPLHLAPYPRAEAVRFLVARPR